MKKIFTSIILCCFLFIAHGQPSGSFNGLDMGLGNLSRLSDAKTRSIGPENLTGEPGKGGMATLVNGSAKSAAAELGQGWKVNPFVVIEPGQTFTMAEISGGGSIQHI